MQYIELMEDLRFELAAEYLVMAAMLAEIKSRMLLPRPWMSEDDEDDPRAELIRRLQEYERFKQAAEDIEELPQVGTRHRERMSRVLEDRATPRRFTAFTDLFDITEGRAGSWS
jgi:chromatin segregation and condensation protein Rec8/ScpA/Scc1 (kleisin family)